ncbi:MAG: fatty acid desaturase [Myxococcota bacterium]|nr:fatty acid desaturase [Myxococcota bacterium]
MTPTSDELRTIDRQSFAIARKYVGEFQWPTLVITAVGVLAYGTVLALVIGGSLPVLVGMLLAGLAGYGLYLPFHESVHQNISGRHSGRRWVDVGVGVVLGQIVAIPYTAHRRGHLAHHARTNTPSFDPDYDAIHGRSLVVGSTRALGMQLRHYVEQRWSVAPVWERGLFCAEVSVAITWRVAIGIVAGATVAIPMFVGGTLIAFVIMLILLAREVHPDRAGIGRHKDTVYYTVDALPRHLARAVTWFWFFHNLHGIHHLYPRVPFYRMEALFAEIRPLIERAGSEIVELGAERTRQAIQPSA